MKYYMKDLGRYTERSPKEPWIVRAQRERYSIVRALCITVRARIFHVTRCTDCWRCPSVPPSCAHCLTSCTCRFSSGVHSDSPCNPKANPPPFVRVMSVAKFFFLNSLPFPSDWADCFEIWRRHSWRLSAAYKLIERSPNICKTEQQLF